MKFSKLNKKNVLMLLATAAVLIFLGDRVYKEYQLTGMFLNLYGEPEYMKVDPARPIDDQVRVLELAGRKFAIPLKYIDGVLDKGLVQDGINLKYVLPNYLSMWDLENRQEYLDLFHAGHTAHMLLLNQSAMPPLEVSAKNLFESYSKTVSIQQDDGLEGYNAYRILSHKEILYDQFYFEKSFDGVIIGYILCNAEDRVPKPGCSYSFVDKGIRYDIYFNAKNYLSSWKEQKLSAINFIDRYEIVSQSKSTKGE